jgi:hypothetical protein
MYLDTGFLAYSDSESSRLLGLMAYQLHIPSLLVVALLTDHPYPSFSISLLADRLVDNGADRPFRQILFAIPVLFL